MQNNLSKGRYLQRVPGTCGGFLANFVVWQGFKGKEEKEIPLVFLARPVSLNGTERGERAFVTTGNEGRWTGVLGEAAKGQKASVGAE